MRRQILQPGQFTFLPGALILLKGWPSLVSFQEVSWSMNCQVLLRSKNLIPLLGASPARRLYCLRATQPPLLLFLSTTLCRINGRLWYVLKRLDVTRIKCYSSWTSLLIFVRVCCLVSSLHRERPLPSDREAVWSQVHTSTKKKMSPPKSWLSFLPLAVSPACQLCVLTCVFIAVIAFIRSLQRYQNDPIRWRWRDITLCREHLYPRYRIYEMDQRQRCTSTRGEIRNGMLRGRRQFCRMGRYENLHTFQENDRFCRLFFSSMVLNGIAIFIFFLLYFRLQSSERDPYYFGICSASSLQPQNTTMDGQVYTHTKWQYDKWRSRRWKRR